MLEAFGLSAHAETVYFQLLRDPGSGVARLGENLGLTPAQIRLALDELSRLALLRPSEVDPFTLRPVPPGLGLETLLAKQQSDLAARRLQVEQGRAALARVVAEYTGTQSEKHMVEEVIGLDAIRIRLESMTAGTCSEVLSLVPDGAQRPAALEASRPLDQRLLDRGVRTRTVYLDSVRNDPATSAYARWLAKQGGEVRTTATLPLRLTITDRSAALIPISPVDSAAGAAVLTGDGAVAAMCALFDQVWNAATPLASSPVRDEQGLTAQEAALVRMLANGDTDDVIARRLGVSVRTVGRLVSDLSGRIGARSRFQAGTRAVELGWLRAAPEAVPAGAE